MELKPGEVECPKCNGKGTITKWLETNYLAGYRYPRECQCPKCHGVGKLDWVEAVVGKKKKYDKIKFRTMQGFNYINKNSAIISVNTS
jgi:DnaJ-class molecular chaperone